MYAIRLHAFGPPENLVHEEVADPLPGPGQVRVAVEAAGVHLLDAALREGFRGPAPAPVPLPTVPGREVAGVVEALGEGTDAVWLGRRVVAHLGFVPGGYAELAVPDAERLHEIPANLDAAQAVAMIGTGRTAPGIAQFTEPGPPRGPGQGAGTGARAGTGTGARAGSRARGRAGSRAEARAGSRARGGARDRAP